MRMIATNDNLDFVKMYDLGDRASEGPDHGAFNYDITTKSDLYYMEYDEYIRLLQVREAGEEQKAAAEARIRARQSEMFVYGGVA